MNTKKLLSRNPATPKKEILMSSCLLMLLSVCVVGCRSSDQRKMTGRNGSADARTPGTNSVKSPYKVVLLGDSIMGGYAPTVQRELAGLAETKGLSRTTSSNLLARLDEVIALQPEVIHLNCGLWDLIVLTNTGNAQVSLEEYKSNLEKIFQRLQRETHAKVIWATTTPVNEQKQQNPRPKGYGRIVRRELDVKIYNRASIEVAKRSGVKYDDLFTVMTEAGRDEHLKDDGVHFNEAGYELLGQSVAKIIRSNLNKPRKATKANPYQ
jgi:lysophospholipase L1-like esterase